MDLKEFKKLGMVFALAAGVTTGGVVGGGVLYNQYHTPSAQVQTTVQMTANNRSVTEAEIVKVDAQGRITVRAHTWVGQYMVAQVAPAGGPLNGAAYSAQFTDAQGAQLSTVKAGDKVWLRGMEGTSDLTNVQLPPTKPNSDVVLGPVQAKVTRVVDGDTPAVVAEIWPGTFVTISTRVGGIDTPEKKGRAKNAYEADLAEQATAATRELVEGKTVLLYNVEYEKYGGRVLADVKTLDGVDVAQNLINKGLARPYDGGTKQPWVAPKGWKAPAPAAKH
ncbi:MAG: thermonuclease family protein [Alphaproteobacteria bacterium]